MVVGGQKGRRERAGSFNLCARRWVKARPERPGGHIMSVCWRPLVWVGMCLIKGLKPSQALSLLPSRHIVCVPCIQRIHHLHRVLVAWLCPQASSGSGNSRHGKAADPNFIGYTFKNIEAVHPPAVGGECRAGRAAAVGDSGW